MSIPKNPALELARKQKRLLYWREKLNAEKVPGDLHELHRLLTRYGMIVNKLALDETLEMEPSPEFWAEAESLESRFNSAFNSTRLETARADVLPEAR